MQDQKKKNATCDPLDGEIRVARRRGLCGRLELSKRYTRVAGVEYDEHAACPWNSTINARRDGPGCRLVPVRWGWRDGDGDSSGNRAGTASGSFLSQRWIPGETVQAVGDAPETN